MSNSVYVGADAPEAIRITVSTGQSGRNLSTATSAAIFAKSPEGTVKEWACVVSSVTASSVVCTHEWDADDVDIAGQWRCYVQVALANGDTFQSKRIAFIALNQFG